MSRYNFAVIDQMREEAARNSQLAIKVSNMKSKLS